MRDHLLGLHDPLELQGGLHQMVSQAPRSLMVRDGDAVDGSDLEYGALLLRAVLGTARAALQSADRLAEAVVGQVLHRGQHPAVDLAGLDVVAAAAIDGEAGIGERLLSELGLRHQEVLDHARGTARGLRERVLAGRAVERRRLEQLPAVQNRLRVDLRRALAGRLDREVQVRGEAVRLADPAEDGAGVDLRPLAQTQQLHRLVTGIAGRSCGPSCRNRRAAC